MSTDIDWQSELDDSFGTGHDVPPEHYVAAGRTAVRRRRRGAVVAGLLAASVVLGVAWGVAPDGASTRTDAPVASNPNDSQDTSASEAWPVDEPPARYWGDGIEVRDGAVVHERRDDLYPGKDTESAALDVSYDGERWWVAFEWGATEARATVERPEESRFASFDAFVADRVRGGGMITRPSWEEPNFFGGPAALTADGLVLAPKAGRVLERVPNPMGYTAAQGRSVAIRVMFRGQEHYSLMARLTDGSTSTNDGAATGDFEGWLANYVQSQRTLDVLNGVTGGAGADDGADPSSWLRLGRNGDVEAARDGVEVLEVRVNVDLGESFGMDAERTGAVRLFVDGTSRFAVYRVLDSQLEVIPGPGEFDSLTTFIDWAREQYASGGGMR